MTPVRRDLRQRRTDDSGFTLVELLIAAGLLVITIALVGSIMVSLVTTERTVAGVAAGTTGAQLTATAIDDRISQSSSFQVTTIGSDQMVIARVAGRDDDLSWECYAWYYSASGDGSIRYTTAPDGTVISVPTANQFATWNSLLDGVTREGTTPVFVASGDRLTTTFNAQAGTSDPVAIRLTSIGLTGVPEESTCF